MCYFVDTKLNSREFSFLLFVEYDPGRMNLIYPEALEPQVADPVVDQKSGVG